MRRLIIIMAILLSTALIVFLAHEGAFTQPQKLQSAEMIVRISTTNEAFAVLDNNSRLGSPISEKEVLQIKGVRLIGKVYKYEMSPGCTVYCAGSDCWKFCW